MKSKHLFFIALWLFALLTACQEEDLTAITQQTESSLPVLNLEDFNPANTTHSVEQHQDWERLAEAEKAMHAQLQKARSTQASAHASREGGSSYENPNNNPCDIDEEDLRILFIGNSHTANYSIDLPRLFEDFAVHNGQDIDVVETAAVNGFTLANHLSYGPTVNKVNQGDWDYVILQENSGVLTSSSTQFVNSVNSFINLIDNNSPDAKVLLYEIAPPYSHTSTTYSNLYSTWNTLFTTLANNYSHVYVVNVARSLDNAYNGLFGYTVANPDFLRYDAQFGYHMASTGGFLAAATFYSAVFRGKPCVPASMYFYLGNGNFGYDTVPFNVHEYDIMVQIGYLAELAIHDRPGGGRAKCISYPVGVYPCP